MFKASDWWSAKGWVPATPERACIVCGSSFGVAFHPTESYPDESEDGDEEEDDDLDDDEEVDDDDGDEDDDEE